MKINFVKKKNQKQILNLSILLLFILVLNVNFTFTVKNLEFKYTEDIYKENIEELTPELIIENPKNADYIDHLDFWPYGIYIYGPQYIQRFVGQSTANTIYFKPYDSIGDGFSEIKIFVNDIEQFSYNWNSYTIEFGISNFLTTTGVHNIRVQALSERSNEWVSLDSTLNVTSSSPCIAPFYDDFKHIYDRWASLDWKIDVFSTYYYNYSIYINNIESQYETLVYDEDINFYFTDNGNYNNNLGAINEIRLEIMDKTGQMTINQFNITNIAEHYPWINYFDKNCYIEYLTLWETEGFKLTVSANDDSYDDLDKIVIFVNNLPFHTIVDANSNTEYEIPISTNLLNNLIDEDDNFEKYLEFRAIAINDDGFSSDFYSSQNPSIYLRNYNYPRLIEKTEEVTSGRNIETLNIVEESNSDIEYSLTVVTDVISPTTLTIAGSTGTSFEQNTNYEDHCYNQEDGSCDIFGQIDDNNFWGRGGMVFWVSAANISAVQYPIIVKIIYPEEIQPDGINDVWNLQFMHWRDNCETQDRGWYIYRNESISEDRDETLKDKGDNTLEILIYSPGLFAFGMEPGDDFNRGGLFISSFPIGLLSFSIGIAFISIFLKANYKMKKK